MRSACLLFVIAGVVSPMMALAQDTKFDTQAAASKRVLDLQPMSCRQYTALPEADRAPVIKESFVSTPPACEVQ